MENGFISLGQLLDATIDQYKKQWKNLSTISLLAAIAMLPIVWILNMPLQNIWATIAIAVAGMLLAIIARPVTIVSLIAAIQGHANQKDLSPKAALLLGKNKLLPALGVNVLSGLLLSLCFVPFALGIIAVVYSSVSNNAPSWISLGGIVLTLGGALFGLMASLWASTTLTFSYFFVALENKKTWAALKAGVTLTQGRFWSTFFRLFLTTIIFSFGFFILGFIASIAIFTLGSMAAAISPIFEPLFAAIMIITRLLLVTISLPIFILVQYHLYVDLRK